MLDGILPSRPTLKRKCRELVDLLLLAEQLALLPENEGQGEPTARAIEEAWWYAAASNHHDFVTGTAADRVVRTEQEPWLDRRIAEAKAAIRRPGATRLTGATERSRRRCSGGSRRGDILEISTPHYVIELAESKGGSIVRAWHPVTGAPLLSVSNSVVSYRDSGGLWRMGHEYAGGWLREAGRSSDRPAQLEVHDDGGCLEATHRWRWTASDSSGVSVRPRLARSQIPRGGSGRRTPHGDHTVRHRPGSETGWPWTCRAASW